LIIGVLKIARRICWKLFVVQCSRHEVAVGPSLGPRHCSTDMWGSKNATKGARPCFHAALPILPRKQFARGTQGFESIGDFTTSIFYVQWQARFRYNLQG